MEKPDKIYYQTMTKKEVEERQKKNDIILIPFGSTENHGDAQPYGEDVFIVTRTCEMIAQKTGCTVAEPVWYASHPFSHLGQKGTVPIPDDVTSALVRSIISGFWNAGFRKQILMSSHGQENQQPVAPLIQCAQPAQQLRRCRAAAPRPGCPSSPYGSRR